MTAAALLAGCGGDSAPASGDDAALSGGDVSDPPASDAAEPPPPGTEPDDEPDVAVTEEPDPPEAPNLRPELWHTCAAWVRHDSELGVGSRFNLFNPADVPMNIDLHLFHPDGTVAFQKHDWRVLAASASVHPTLGELLVEAGIEGSFEGSLWMGSKPESGPTFLGLQGFGVDWFGPSNHCASVHAMRDFGNSNHDKMWTDMVLPRVVRGDRFETWIAVANGSGVSGDLERTAKPEIIVNDDQGGLLGKLTLEPIGVYGTRLVKLGEIVGDKTFESATIQVREPEVGLVALAFVVDTKYGGYTNADHFFDRHFVDCVPFGSKNGCSTFLEPF